jgi:DNA modification methylase
MSRQDSLFTTQEPRTRNQEPVECLGKTFDSNEARRGHFLGLLREGLEELHAKLGGVPFTTVEDAVERMKSVGRAEGTPEGSASGKVRFKWPMGDEVRLRELAERMRHADPKKDLLQRWKDEVGFPHGEIEDILNLSDPPYYSACPNPFIADFIKRYGKPYDPETDDYRREPFAADVSEGKNDAIYQAHSYHTKVPYKAIQRYIEHFTEPNDIVADLFCGTGMTGIAASSLRRNSILADLSPYATFIAHNYCRSVSTEDLRSLWKRLVHDVEDEVGWVYQCSIGPSKGTLQYAVWSDHYFCPNCMRELVFWDLLVDENENMRDVLACPHCLAVSKKHEFQQVLTTNGEVKRSLVKVYELRNGKKLSRKPSKEDFALVENCTRQIIVANVPTDLLMFRGTRFGDMYVPRQHAGITKVDDFYLHRSLLVISTFFRHIAVIRNEEIRSYLLWAFLSIQNYVNKKQSYFGGGGGQPGTLTISDIIQEKNVIQVIDRKVKKLIALGPQVKRLLSSERSVIVSTQSAINASEIPSNSIDYAFTDPPFGRNLMYSELNFINEAWLRIFTNNQSEAIVNKSQKKGRQEYFALMASAFREYYRILKPGRWITVEFHNSSSVIWNGIQEGIGLAGFVVAQVAVLDKKELTFKQLASPSGAVSKDLVISAYKPNGGLEDRFKLNAGTEGGVWDFVRAHLNKLPVFVSKDGKSEVIAERQNYLLFDRMVAFHVQRGVTVPLSAGEFYAGLAQRFPERDGMYFLPEQVAEYDKKRMKVKEVLQLEFFVIDEASAIQWLKQQLTRKPQTFQELHPQFLKEIGGWQKHEKPLELSELLEQNFLRYDGKGEVPSQIHSYLSSNFKELRNLAKDDERLRAKGKDRWYVPDPNKASDLEKIRERALLREFQEYRESKQKRLKVFRLEAVRAGFKKAWQERDYATIIAVARKIPENVLQEDPKLLMWYDQALTRMGEEGGR